MRLTKSLKPLTSNFSVEEQELQIEKTLSSLSTVSKCKLFDINGISSSSFSFYKTKYFNPDLEPLASIDNLLLLDLLKIINKNYTNRLLSITLSDKIEINDFLNKENYHSSAKFKGKLSFLFDSRIFYIFKINKKTINKHTKLLVFKNYILIISSRKGIYFIFQISTKTI